MNLEDATEFLPKEQNLTRQKIAVLSAVIIPFAGLVTGCWLWADVNWVCLTTLFVFYAFTGLGVTVGYHRLFTHLSFKARPSIETILAIGGSMAVEGSVLDWCADHRNHHAESDTPKDLHSPWHYGGGVIGALKGLWHAHMGWIFTKIDADKNKYIPDLLKNRRLVIVNRLFPLLIVASLALPTVMGGLLTLSWKGAFYGFLWGGLIRIFLLHHLTWSINSICHYFGSRPFKSRDQSANNVFFGIFGLGEGWHNNHHAFPNSARHGLRWYQVDWSWMVIRGLEKLRLVTDVKVPSSEQMRAMRRIPTNTSQ